MIGVPQDHRILDKSTASGHPPNPLSQQRPQRATARGANALDRCDENRGRIVTRSRRQGIRRHRAVGRYQGKPRRTSKGRCPFTHFRSIRQRSKAPHAQRATQLVCIGHVRRRRDRNADGSELHAGIRVSYRDGTARDQGIRQRLSAFFLERWNDASMSQRNPDSGGVHFIVAGYDEGKPYGTVYLLNVPRQPDPQPRQRGGVWNDLGRPDRNR